VSAASQRRPVQVGERGLRVVLVIPRAEPDSRVGATLDAIARQGWRVSAIIDPARHLDALRMILKDLADVIVAVHPDHMPSLKFATDLPPANGRSAGHRTTRILRPMDPDHRRARPVELPVVQPVLPEAVVPEPVMAEPQIKVRSSAADLPEPSPEPRVLIPASRRASQSHRSGVARRRRT
jgi:hypothetical protein